MRGPHPSLHVTGRRPDAAPADRASAVRRDFRAFYDLWFDDVLRWVRALGGNEADRDDIAQDVFVVVRQRFEQFDGANPAGWLYQITRRKVRDARRRAWIRRVFTRDHFHELDTLTCERESPAGTLERKQKQRVLDTILGKMNPNRRAAFVLFEIEGLAGEEIARIQGIPVKTVWWRVHMARKEFLALADKYRRAHEGGGG
ncbi:MAG TPA: RNA polymerase sigma factor [Polyangia bacterium]|nr:RNA polymerase sigma factor [Polyangia bacterium]